MNDKKPYSAPDLRGKIALVAGATRGAGRGIALTLGETPLFVGRAVAALAADPQIMKKSGRAFSSWGLSDEYGFCDADGAHPHWGRHFAAKYGDCMKSCDESFYEYWSGGPIDVLWPDWP